MKITYSGIIFVFGFYTQVVVVKQHWNWWRKKMEEPDNSLMVMVGVYVHNLICNFFQVSHASMVLSSNLGTWLRKASRTTCGPPFFLALVFLVGICIVAGLSFFRDAWTSFLVLREKVRARMNIILTRSRLAGLLDNIRQRVSWLPDTGKDCHRR